MSGAVNKDDDSIDSFSSDSDDEFLTMREDGGNVDREALIRKKLLENFYGKSAVDDDGAVGGSSGSGFGSSDDESDDDDDKNKVLADPSAIEDLDSTHFSSINHTQKHVLNEGVHSLLETEEHLACQVRTLDSSMQTLVYENYSRFIEATDAIRSIGINVQANQANLSKLQGNMHIVSETSQQVEQTVGALRDQVVEKIRVKRLLQRLDTLLKLPVTLRQQIAAGRYRWGTKSYLSADMILRKHSTGFESLQRIEVECHDILEKLLIDVRRKLLHWSGFVEEEDTDLVENPPDPPKTVSDIFECAGTPVLVILAQEENNTGSGEDQTAAGAGTAGTTTAGQAPPARFQPGLTIDQCKEKSLSASLRLMERVLDTHHLELQESLFDGSQPPMDETKSRSGTNLIPTNVLDSILEASTLYSMTFHKSGEMSESLSQFVLMAFNTFLQHVRMELLEQAMQAQPQLVLRSKTNDDEDPDEDAKQVDSEEQAYEQVSNSMAILLQSVRQLSSGLALPEVAIEAELASSLVDQTIGLTEAMVRRRVDQKFYSLRLRVIEDCLAPFCRSAMMESSDDEIERGLLDVVQMASVSLSDSLQLVDDTIRSTLAVSEADAEDTSMIKFAVEHSTKRFAKWLAGAMEVLGGCESSDSDTAMDVKFEEDPAAELDDDDVPKSANVSLDGLSRDDMSEKSQEQSDPNQVVQMALSQLMEELPQTGPKKLLLALAVAEMCRVAERSVMDNISQSIATHGGGSKQRKLKSKSTSLFDGDANQDERTTSTSHRFRLAASRVLGLYATTRGCDAATLLCSNLYTLAATSDDEPVGPREAAWQVLEIIKMTSLDCADLFGGSKRAGPIPETLEDEYQSLTIGRQKSGLAFDVERMFAEKIFAYPDPSDISDFQRNSIVALVFKVALKSLVENARLVKFSVGGYRQLMVDVEFIKHLIPHYVKDEETALFRLLTDAVTAAGDRCIGAVVRDDEVNPARSVVRSFIATNSETIKKITIESDE